MATIPTLTYLQSDESIILPLITQPELTEMDLFESADRCAALVSVLLETDDPATRAMLSQCLLQTLYQLRELCDADLPPHLIAQLIVGEKLTSCVPDCWQETAIQVDHALAMTQAIISDTLPASVTKELTGLLHDLVWLLAEFVKEPYITSH